MKGREMKPVTSIKHPLRAYTERLHPKGIPFSGSTYMKGSDFTRLQNSPYFCVFKYARAVKQKVWDEAENREGETLKIHFFLAPHLFEVNKRHAAGVELITLIMKRLCSGLSCSSSTENKVPDFTKALIRNIS